MCSPILDDAVTEWRHTGPAHSHRSDELRTSQRSPRYTERRWRRQLSTSTAFGDTASEVNCAGATQHSRAGQVELMLFDPADRYSFIPSIYRKFNWHTIKQYLWSLEVNLLTESNHRSQSINLRTKHKDSLRWKEEHFGFSIKIFTQLIRL